MCLLGAVAAYLVFPPHHDEASRPFSVHGFLHNAHLFEDESDVVVDEKVGASTG